MRRVMIASVVALALVAASCGSSTDDGPTSSASPADDTQTTGATSPPSGPVAPDFTLALGEDGASTFTLSQEAKPVYMVFWAEW